MSDPESSLNFLGLLAIFGLVAANGFFVAAEFSLVAVRRSRVAEMIGERRMNAAALMRATGNLDSHLAACQLGITISSLALGWIGEPALAQLIEPGLAAIVPAASATSGAHVVAVAIAFTLITVLHIVLGELAPKGLALQRTEGTALWVVRPLGLFLFLLRPAITALNGLGNLVLKLFGLRTGASEQSLHSPDELKLLIAASQQGGLLHKAQQEVVARALSIGDRTIASIMTPRPDVDWVDLDDDREAILRTIRVSQHDQLLVGRGRRADPLGLIAKKDLLEQVLDGKPIDLTAVIREPLVLHESVSIFKVLEQFKRAPVHMAVIVDEYGTLQGVVTQADLLEAVAGDLPDVEGEEPDIVTRADGSLLIDGMMSVQEALERLGLDADEVEGDFHTIAGFALDRLGHLPETGERFEYEGWQFEIVDMDGRRIDKMLASRLSRAREPR
jgi:CBS domain containing-hemolysin-like protein